MATKIKLKQKDIVLKSYLNPSHVSSCLCDLGVDHFTSLGLSFTTCERLMLSSWKDGSEN